MIGLHAGDHALPPETRDVGRVDCLDVLNTVAPRSRAIRGGGTLECVERHTHAPIADRVDLELPATIVSLPDERVELFRGPFRVPARGVSLVRREHRRGPRLDDAIGEAL